MNTLTGPYFYGFSNAKVSALKGKLFDKHFYSDLVAVANLSSVVELLEKTPYKKYLEVLLRERGLSPETIEAAMVNRFSHLIYLLKHYTPEYDEERLRSFLLRYDIISAKIVLGGKLKGNSFEEVKGKLILGNLTLEEWRKIYSSKQPVKVFLYTLFSYDKAQALLDEIGSEELNNETLITISQWLDGLILREAQNLKGMFAYKYLAKYVDIQNIIALIKTRKEGKKSSEFLKSIHIFGTLSKEELSRALKSDAAYKELLKRYGLSEEMSLPLIQSSIEKTLSSDKKKLYAQSIFTLDRVFLYLLLLEEELLNVRRIVLGKALSMPKTKIMEVLVL